MNADGTQVRRLTNDTAEEISPVFSPTANQIAFVSDRDKPPTQGGSKRLLVQLAQIASLIRLAAKLRFYQISEH